MGFGCRVPHRDGVLFPFPLPSSLSTPLSFNLDLAFFSLHVRCHKHTYARTPLSFQAKPVWSISWFGANHMMVFGTNVFATCLFFFLFPFLPQPPVSPPPPLLPLSYSYSSSLCQSSATDCFSLLPHHVSTSFMVTHIQFSAEVNSVFPFPLSSLLSLRSPPPSPFPYPPSRIMSQARVSQRNNLNIDFFSLLLGKPRGSNLLKGTIFVSLQITTMWVQTDYCRKKKKKKKRGGGGGGLREGGGREGGGGGGGGVAASFLRPFFCFNVSCIIRSCPGFPVFVFCCCCFSVRSGCSRGTRNP